jgi:hypothetical protein
MNSNKNYNTYDNNNDHKENQEYSNNSKLGKDNESSSSSGDEDDTKRKIKRRTKNDNDERNYVCKICGKTYLSYPALYTHNKTKHNVDGNNTTRGRGRPKKDNGENVFLFYLG